MFARTSVFLLSLFAINLWAGHARAEDSLVVFGLDSLEGDDNITRPLTADLRAAAAGHWMVSPHEVTSSQMQLAYECTLSQRSCRESIGADQHVALMLYGTVHRIDLGTSYEYSVEIYYAGTASEGVIATFVGRLPARATADEIRALATDAIDHLAPRRPSSSSLDWLGWSLVGLGAAAFIADIGIWIRLNDMSGDADYTAYRERIPMAATDNICHEAAAGRNWWNPSSPDTEANAVRLMNHAASLCSEASVLEVLQYVLLGTAVAAIGIGTTILILGGADSNTLAIRPSLSPNRAMLLLEGRF